MRTRIAMAAAMLAVLPFVVRAADAPAPMSVAALEAAGAKAVQGAALAKFISGRQVEFTTIDGGARETVTYGDRRVDASGRATDYEVGDSGIIEQTADGERAVSFYRERKLTYACVNLQCPYLVTSSAPGRGPAPASDNSKRNKQ